MNGDEVRNVRFRRGFYDASQVNDLLDRIAAELDAGRPAGPLIASATFRIRPIRLGYDVGAVDWFLEQLRRREDRSELARMTADPWRDLAVEPYSIRSAPGGLSGRVAAPSLQECAEAWRDFGQQPGTRLSWVRTGAVRHELRTAEQQAVASLRHGRPATLSAGGRTFTWKRVPGSSWPDIAKTISRDRPGSPAHMLRDEETPLSRKRQAESRDLLLRHLLDEAGMPILYTGGQNIGRSAGAYIKFPGQRWLRFPVRGTRRVNAIMTAVDQAGNKVARYRLTRNETSFWKTIEITVHPAQQLTDELALAIALSPLWLRPYFRSEGGGG